MKNGVQLYVNYVVAKASDMGSDTERGYNQQLFSSLINSWNPKGNRGPSDFDVRHSIVGNLIVALPFGRGAAFAFGANRALNTLIGGWGLSGPVQCTKGLPLCTVQRLVRGATGDDQRVQGRR